MNSSSNGEPEKESVGNGRDDSPAPAGRLRRLLASRNLHGHERDNAEDSKHRRVHSDLSNLTRRWVLPSAFDREKIYKKTRLHVPSEEGSYRFSGLVKFDDISIYSIPDDKEEKLLRLEINRLIAGVQNVNEPLIFDPAKDASISTTTTFEQDQNDVYVVVRAINNHMQLIHHDNSVVVLEHLQYSLGPLLADFNVTRGRLYAVYKFGREYDHDYVSTMQDPERKERRRRLYFLLVDYLTLLVARFLITSAGNQSGSWYQHVMAILAGWSVKLKVLSYDPERYAKISLSRGEATVSRMVAENEDLEVLKLNKDEDDEKTVDIRRTLYDVKSQYYVESIMRRQASMGIGSIFEEILGAVLLPHGFQTLSLRGVEATTILRKTRNTSADQSSVVLSSDLDQSVSASSEDISIECTYNALTMLSRNVAALEKECTDVTTDNSLAIVQWRWSTEESKQLKITNIKSLVSFLLPLSLTSPSASGRLRAMVTNSSWMNLLDDDPITTLSGCPSGLEAMCSISSMPNAPDLLGIRFAKDVSSLAESDIHLWLRNGLGGARKLAHHEDKMRDWIFAEDTITIRCTGFVVSVMLGALFFVAGGLSIPFLVKERITGVDPFNVTSFIWLLTAFAMVVAKSRYVVNWPWHDFLRAKVVCQSVKEVGDVTGIDEQSILCFLLRREIDVHFATRGPYNGMFTNALDEEYGGKTGFSIDEPVEWQTMIVGGFIPIKVRNDDGEHLVWADFRKGTRGISTIEKAGTSGERPVLVCADIDREERFAPSKGRPTRPIESGVAFSIKRRPTTLAMKKDRRAKYAKLGRSTRHVVKMKYTKEFSWTEILGIYVMDMAFG